METAGVPGPAATPFSGQALRKSNWTLLEQAVQMKTEGNAFYRERNLRSAIKRYHGALLILRGLDSDVFASIKGLGPGSYPLSPEQESLLRNTQVDVFNNLAACLLLKESVNYARVQDYSLRVLRWQPHNVKALYRAGVATLELGDARMAKMYLTRAFKVQPNDVNVKKYLQKAEEKLNQELAREKALYRGMFSPRI
ncbi:tetratricopeptide repeat protein 9C [Eucyclogobius newberryi]|uniref:tetratricopeptide repeat protein 9C n=1 Tax=Eucyclogobius newberryi TaxID=166745 RepID=UPI003B58EB31